MRWAHAGRVLLDLAWLLAPCSSASGQGSLTGLIPGFHVNNVALILPRSVLPCWIWAFSGIGGRHHRRHGTVHTFPNYIPSALIGAPDDTALSLLPPPHAAFGQRSRGVACQHEGRNSACSSPLIVLARIAFGPELGWYEKLRSVLPLCSRPSLFALGHRNDASTGQAGSADDPRKTRARFGLLVSWQPRRSSFAGMYGWGVFTLPARSPVGMPDASLLCRVWPGCSARQPLGHLRHDLTPSAATRKLGPATCPPARGTVPGRGCRGLNGRPARYDGLTSHGLGTGRNRSQGPRKARLWYGLGDTSSHGTQRR